MYKIQEQVLFKLKFRTCIRMWTLFWKT